MKPAIDISDDQWVVLIGLLRRFLPDVEVWAHGSRVKWTARPTSDLDLVAFCTQLDRRPLSQLKDALAESSLPFVVDLLVWDDVPVSFHDNIKSNHVVLQEAAQQKNTFSQHGRWAVRQVEELMRAGVLVIGDGYRAKNSELSTAGFPFARAGNINNGFDFSDADRFPSAELERVGNKLSQPGDVVFTSKGTVGRFAYVRPETPRFVYSPQLCFWRSAKPAILDPRFLYYWMLGREFYVQFKGVSGQTDMAEYVSLTDQRRMYITLPPKISEQRAIASILGALDDKIESNRRTSRALERVARALFRAWFVDFEPVKAKAAGARAFPGMPPETFAALPSRLVPSELGPIPEGWRVGSIGSEVTVCGGSTPSTKELSYWTEGVHHWVTPKDLSGMTDPILLSTERKLTDAGVATISSGLLPVGAVLLSSRAPVGYLVIAGVPTAINQGFIAMICDKELPPVYVYHWTHSVMDEIKSRASGTTFPEISKTAFRPMRLCVPSQPVVRAFASNVDPLFQKVAANISESRHLATLRDYLLPKLLSGAVRAPEVQEVGHGG